MGIMKLKDAIAEINKRDGRRCFYWKNNKSFGKMSGKGSLHGQAFYDAWDKAHAKA